MSTYIVRRLVTLVPVLLGVSAAAFLLIHLIPGDPAMVYLGERATPESIARVQHEFGLDRPLPLQYVIYLWDAVRGNFGESLDSHRAVIVEFIPRFPATIELTLGAITIAVAVGIPIGLLSASRPNSVVDRLGMALALLGVSFPVFWLGLIQKARTETSKNRRAQMYAQAETIALNDYRDILIANARVPLLLRKNVSGLVGQPDGNEYMETVSVR